MLTITHNQNTTRSRLVLCSAGKIVIFMLSHNKRNSLIFFNTAQYKLHLNLFPTQCNFISFYSLLVILWECIMIWKNSGIRYFFKVVKLLKLKAGISTSWDLKYTTKVELDMSYIFDSLIPITLLGTEKIICCFIHNSMAK